MKLNSSGIFAYYKAMLQYACYNLLWDTDPVRAKILEVEPDVAKLEATFNELNDGSLNFYYTAGFAAGSVFEASSAKDSNSAFQSCSEALKLFNSLVKGEYYEE